MFAVAIVLYTRVQCGQASFELSVYSNSNIHRAVHRLSVEATAAYEESRDAVCSFINAESREEIIFTS